MPIKTAHELMRSRYQAYVNKNEEHLLATWHKDTRPNNIDFGQQPNWLGLEIISTRHGSEQDDEGHVHFKAYYIDNKKITCLEEESRFIKIENQWFYYNGELYDNTPWLPGRNELCPCQSGKKFKRCCLKKVV